MSKITQFAAVGLIGVMAGFVGGALAASLFARWDRIKTPPDVIRAKQFEAVGEKGVVRARFGLDSGDVPVIRFFGSDNKERFSIMLDNVEEPTMAMQDVKRNVRVVFGHETSDTASPSDDDWYVSFFEPEEDHFSATAGVRRSYGPPPSRNIEG